MKPDATAEHSEDLDSFLSDRYIEKTVSKTKQTIQIWRRKGIFPALVKLGHITLGTRKSDFDSWMQNPQAWVEANKEQTQAA